MARREPRSDVSLFVKYLMFFFNFIIWLTSVVIFGVGIYANIEKDKYLPDSGVRSKDLEVADILFDLTVFFIFIGGILFIVSFMGCIGALRENTCILNIFAVAVGIVFLLEVVAAVLIFVFQEDVTDKVEKLLQDEGIEKYRDDPDWHDFVNWVQEEFNCCGVSDDGYKDWNKNVYFNCSTENRSPEACGVPYSCCKDPDDITEDVINTMCGYGKQALSESEASEDIYTTGCLENLRDFLENNLYIMAGIVMGVAIVQLLCIFFSRTLVGQIEFTKSLAR